MVNHNHIQWRLRNNQQQYGCLPHLCLLPAIRQHVGPAWAVWQVLGTENFPRHRLVAFQADSQSAHAGSTVRDTLSLRTDSSRLLLLPQPLSISAVPTCRFVYTLPAGPGARTSNEDSPKIGINRTVLARRMPAMRTTPISVRMGLPVNCAKRPLMALTAK